MVELCTYFDRNYLPQGLALYRSLERHTPDARLWVLCLDDFTEGVLRRLELPQVVPISLEAFLGARPELRMARRDRSSVEFYYACTAPLVQYVLAAAPDAAGASYVDADMFFFRNARTVYEQAPAAQVLLVEHRSGNDRSEAEHGRFNVCLVRFARECEAERALQWWADRTLESTALGGGTWGDQAYLDKLPERFGGVDVLRDPTSTLAPWNLWQHAIERSADGILVDGRPLLVYHFARFLVLGPHLFMPIRRTWIGREALEAIYRPYMGAVRNAYLEIRRVEARYRVGYTGHNLRGLLLGVTSGRAFYEGPLGLRRIGLYVPSGPAEWRARRRVRGAAGQAAALADQEVLHP